MAKIKGMAREKKWKINKARNSQPKHGMSVFVIQEVVQKRADEIEKKRK